MRNLLFIKGESRYGAVRNYVDEMADAARRLGCNTIIIDAKLGLIVEKLEQVFFTYHIDAVFAGAGILIDYEISQEFNGKKHICRVYDGSASV